MIINYLAIFSAMRTIITILAFIVLVKYFIYLIFAPFYPAHRQWNLLKLKLGIKKGEITGEYEPIVSVIIPAWNEEVGILTTVNSVLANSYEKVEIIVVNDGSTDGTDLKMREFLVERKSSKNDKKIIRYFCKENGGKGSALNFGIKKAKGEIILTMDADSAHHKKAIENLVTYFHDPSIHAVVGNVKVRNIRNIVGLIQQFEYIFGFYFKRVHSILDAEYIFGGACAAFRKKTTFDTIGVFDTFNKTEDIEYSMRVKLNGLKSVYAEDVITYTEGASDLVGLYKQRLRWKKGRLDTFIKYRQLFFSRNNSHSKFMSWVVLPYALIGEIQMLSEPLFFAAIWAYTLISGDYLSVGLSSLFIFITYLAAFGLGDKETNKMNLILFPFTWFMFYILSVIEFLALLRSVEMMYLNQDVTWQNWTRKGVYNDREDKKIELLSKKEYLI